MGSLACGARSSPVAAPSPVPVPPSPGSSLPSPGASTSSLPVIRCSQVYASSCSPCPVHRCRPSTNTPDGRPTTSSSRASPDLRQTKPEDISVQQYSHPLQYAGTLPGCYSHNGPLPSPCPASSPSPGGTSQGGDWYPSEPHWTGSVADSERSGSVPASVPGSCLPGDHAAQYPASRPHAGSVAMPTTPHSPPGGSTHPAERPRPDAPSCDVIGDAWDATCDVTCDVTQDVFT